MGWQQIVEAYSSIAVPLLTAILAAILVTILVFKANRGQSGAVSAKGLDNSKKTFSKSEVAKHTKADDVWIILRNKVYDVTPYVQEHPGGEAILRNAGGDATDGFYAPQHPERVFDLIDDFYIGDLQT